MKKFLILIILFGVGCVKSDEAENSESPKQAGLKSGGAESSQTGEQDSTKGSKKETSQPRKTPTTSKIVKNEITLELKDDSWGFWVKQKGLALAESSIKQSYNPLHGLVDPLKWVGWNWSITPEDKYEAKSIGTLSYPSLLRSGRILTTSAIYEDFQNQWGAEFDLQLIKIPVSWFPSRGINNENQKLLEAIEVELEFGEGVEVQSVFPNTSYAELNWKVEGRFGVGISGFFPLGSGVNGKTDASVGYTFNYQPLVAKVISEGAANHAKWQINSVNDERPLGQITYFCTVLIPKNLKSAKGELNVNLIFNKGKKQIIPLSKMVITVDFGS